MLQAVKLRVQAKYIEALPLAEEAVRVERELLGPNNHVLYASTYNLASVCAGMGDYSRTERLLWEAEVIMKGSIGTRHPAYAQYLNDAAELYREVGDYARAEPLYEQALETWEVLMGRDSPEYAATLGNLAIMYMDIGDLAKAEPRLRLALEIKERTLGEEHPGHGITLANLAALLKQRGEYVEAERLYQQSLKVLGESLGPNHPLCAGILANLGRLHDAMGDYSQARLLTERSFDIRRNTLGARHSACAVSLNGLAMTYRHMGDYTKAEELIQQGMEITRESVGEQHIAYTSHLDELIRLYQLTGDIDKAVALSRQALQIHDHILKDTLDVLSERQQMAMISLSQGTVNQYVSVASEAKLPGEAVYRHVLARKGTVFVRQRASRMARIDPEQAPLLAELENTARQLATTALTVPEYRQQEIRLRQIAELTEKKERLEAELARKSSEFRQLRTSRQVTPAKLESILPDDVALLDFLEYTQFSPSEKRKGELKGESHLAVFVVTASLPIMQLDLGPVGPIVQAIDDWRAAINQAKGRTTAYRATPRAESPQQALRRLLWEPLEAYLRDVQVVLVSPDGALTRCPLPALPGKEPGEFLLEEVPIAVVAVPQMLTEVLRDSSEAPSQKAPGASINSMLLVGDVDFGAGPGQWVAQTAHQHRSAPRGTNQTQFDRLPNTVQEIEFVKRLFQQSHTGSPVEVVRSGEATEEAFRRQARGHRYLHLATHGFFAPPEIRNALSASAISSEPLLKTVSSPRRWDQTVAGFHPGLLSGIVLAGANREYQSTAVPGQLSDDGILTASEVAELDLRAADLVVLSACETGLGAVAGGEGVLGLQRAFQVAGARTTISSLWKVDDAATRALMVEFYKNLWEKKLGKLEALRQAQLTMLREYDPTTGGLRGPGAITPVDPAKLAGAQKTARTDREPLAPFYWAAFVLSGDWR
jgi:CHAT domain-containing protein/Tfp pilus assembly protein PilF